VPCHSRSLDFNSLHAQREACEAFIKSQASEGWKLIKTAYDDGGLSGGNMERPALRRLLADIGEHLIDVVVVYKVHRLTRSLADFAKIVELFDVRGVSFVAVTQQFNTTTSMGRLTLNVLLSFRPVRAGCVRLLRRELDQQGIVSKVQVSRKGLKSGGCKFSRGALYELLANPIYVGEIRHKQERHPGQHEPILERELWEAVQQRLRENALRGATPSTKAIASPLAGKYSIPRVSRFTRRELRRPGGGTVTTSHGVWLTGRLASSGKAGVSLHLRLSGRCRLLRAIF